MARTMPTPLIGENDKHPDAEMVSRIVRVKSVPAAYLVPILRSLLPQSAHLAAVQCTNELIIVDTFANVRRVEEHRRGHGQGQHPAAAEMRNSRAPAESRCSAASRRARPRVDLNAKLPARQYNAPHLRNGRRAC